MLHKASMERVATADIKPEWLVECFEKLSQIHGLGEPVDIILWFTDKDDDLIPGHLVPVITLSLKELTDADETTDETTDGTTEAE